MKLGAQPQRGIGKPLTAKQRQILDTTLSLRAKGAFSATDVCRAVNVRAKDMYVSYQLAEFRSRGLL